MFTGTLAVANAQSIHNDTNNAIVQKQLKITSMDSSTRQYSESDEIKFKNVPKEKQYLDMKREKEFKHLNDSLKTKTQ